MSVRKPIDEGHKRRTADEAELRQKQEAGAFELGVPLCPDQFVHNKRPLYALWKKNAARLLEARLLAFSDGKPLLEFSMAELAGNRPQMKVIFDLTWASRTPFPEEVQLNPGKMTLADFLARAAATRGSFAARRNPDATTAADTNGQPYAWPDSDPAATARNYALDCLQGVIVAGDLLKRACRRFLDDLEHGAERGLHFDPVAARDVIYFAKEFCALPILDWQIFVLANVFGWRRKDGLRRFTESLLSVAKKNGKTKLASVVALWGLVCDGEKFPEVYAAATKREQSRIVWRDAKRTVGDNPELAAHVRRWAGELAVKESDGFFQPLSSDEKSMDGLRPFFIICDELSFWSDREQFDKLAKGIVSRLQPLLFEITTAGSSRNSFAFGKFDLAEKILTGTLADDSTFVCIYRIDTADDWRDEACWPKANPSLEVTLKVEHLRKTAEEAKQDGSGLNSFLQYHCNIWPDKTLRRAGSIPRDKWDACAHLELIGADSPNHAYDKFVPLNKDILCYVGLDVGLVSDFTAIVYLFDHFYLRADEVDAKTGKVINEAPLVTDKRAVIAEFFLPEDKLLDKEKAWRVPLSTWVREKFITLMPGDMIDTRDITKHILETARLQSIAELGFDRWNAMQIGADINASTAVKCTEIPQIPSQTTNPSRELLNLVRRGELIHFGNPVLSWMASNVILEENEKTNGIKPEKPSANEKIDGISALIMALHRQLAAPPRFSGRVILI